MDKNLLYLYHPTTVVFVDDDARFLNNIILNLNLDLSFKTYQDPEVALHDLKSAKQNPLLLHTLSEAQENEEGRFSVDFDISNLYQEVYNPQQFSLISLLIIDFAMPKKNGEEVLHALMGAPFKKLMLTGQADESRAVKLFNDGVIDKFILKTSNNSSLIQSIRDSAQELVQAYFRDSTNIISKALPGQISSCLTDPVFIAFFHKLLADRAISSYYLIEASGSFLLLDANAVPTSLFIKTKDEMLEFAQQAEAEGASEEVVSSIANGEKIPYFSTFDDYVKATEGHWESYLYPAKRLDGKKQYLYALSNQVADFSLRRDKILSFNDYLHSQGK